MDNLEFLIKKNEGLIYHIINKYSTYFEIDDLYQVAVMGLIRAYQKYNSNLGTKFTTYAYPYILGEIIKYINEYRPLKTSKENKLLYGRILKAKEILSQRLMKNPSNYELSLFLEIDEIVIEECLLANASIDSLDKIISEDGKNLELYDKYGYVDMGIENYYLYEELNKLNSEERKIIIARYYNNLTQEEVGKKLGMYQVEVSRTEKKILKRLKDNIAAR